MIDSKQLRKYLLGLITDEADLEQIEMRLLDDDVFLEAMLVEEDELIEDFVDGTLTSKERRNFQANFAATPDRRKKIEFAKAAWLNFGGRPTIEGDDLDRQLGTWDRIRAFIGVNRLGTAAAFGLLLVGFLLVGWIFFGRSPNESAFGLLEPSVPNERPINPAFPGSTTPRFPTPRAETHRLRR